MFSIMAEIPEYPQYISKKKLLEIYSIGVLQPFLKENKSRLHIFRDKNGIWISRKFGIDKLYSLKNFENFIFLRLKTLHFFNLKSEIKMFLEEDNKIYDKNLIGSMAQQSQFIISKLIKKNKLKPYSKNTYLVIKDS